mmetsp:Transcript_118796/g.318727  ORF Transcript_118796/g.318727 Transcript_118796/m.318727 type:complete len:294 (-) Transcript_118796:424-1305(-)
MHQRRPRRAPGHHGDAGDAVHVAAAHVAVDQEHAVHGDVQQQLRTAPDKEEPEPVRPSLQRCKPLGSLLLVRHGIQRLLQHYVAIPRRIVCCVQDAVSTTTVLENSRDACCCADGGHGVHGELQPAHLRHGAEADHGPGARLREQHPRRGDGGEDCAAGRVHGHRRLQGQAPQDDGAPWPLQQPRLLGAGLERVQLLLEMAHVEPVLGDRGIDPRARNVRRLPRLQFHSGPARAPEGHDKVVQTELVFPLQPHLARRPVERSLHVVAQRAVVRQVHDHVGVVLGALRVPLPGD